MIELVELPVECLEVIASFATINELCALDATCRLFGAATSTVTDKSWAKHAMRSYGIQPDDGADGINTSGGPGGAGKEAWRKGKALTSPQRNLHCVFQLGPEGVWLNSGHLVACSPKTIVSLLPRRVNVNIEPYVGNRPIILRDTKTMKLRAILDSDMNRSHYCTDAAIGGTACNEVIAITGGNFGNQRFLGLTQESSGYYEEYNLGVLFPQHAALFAGSNLGLTKILGTSNHFILYPVPTKLLVVKFNGNLPLSSENRIIPVGSYNVRDDSEEMKLCVTRIKWGSDELPPGTFVMSSPGNISVWHLDDSTSELAKIQSVVTSMDDVIYDIGVGQRYIAACTRGKEIDSRAILIFDRHNGKKVWDLEGHFHHMHFIGDLLFCQEGSSSNNLHVWHVPSKTHTVVAQGHETCDSLVKVKGDGYTCFFAHYVFHGRVTVWGFPESDKGLRNLQEISKNHTYVSGPQPS